MAKKEEKNEEEAAARARSRQFTVGGVRDVAAEERAAAAEREAEADWRYHGTDGHGNHYEMDMNRTKNRRVREAGSGPVLQRAWIEGGEWDVKADQAVAKEMAKTMEQSAAEAAAANEEAESSKG